MRNPSGELEKLLAESESLSNPSKGDLISGRLISADSNGWIVDLGLKRDGVIPMSDLADLPADEQHFHVGDQISVMVVDPVDGDGNLVVSIAQAKESGDWLKAQEYLDKDTIFEGQISKCNRGGLIVPFGRLRGFIPASHLSNMPRGLEEDQRKDFLSQFLDRRLPLKVIEVDPRRRRLVLSERKAIRQWRQDQKAKIIETLKVGEIRSGIVTSLREFGAFVDIGGADGLVHISEMAWTHISDPADVLSIGQEVNTMVIRLEPETSRIGLSLKRMLPNPWQAVREDITIGQEVQGVVSRITSSGAYIGLECGIEGLLSLGNPGNLIPGSEVKVVVTHFDADDEKMHFELPDETQTGTQD
jgi:small subunit ribosomal protein S1